MTEKEPSSSPFITVFMPVFNGEEYLDESLTMIEQQELPEGYELEIYVIDSGSTDKSLEIIRRHSSVRLETIPNSEFSHGGTRQFAAAHCKGSYILFITQDATPASTMWLKGMIEPFYLSDKVGCVFGKQIPRPDAPATIKREVSMVFNSLGTDDSIVLHRYKSLVDGTDIAPKNGFFSDANSAVRTNLLRGPVPFRTVHYSEDQLLASDMLDGGYLVAYAPAGAVIHSNQYTARQYLRRKYDESQGLKKSVGVTIPMPKRELIFGTMRATLKDWRFATSDPAYSMGKKFSEIVRAPAYNLNSRLGAYLSNKYDDNPKIKNLFSLEHRARSKNS
jgi:rhamnosyltransferase